MAEQDGRIQEQETTLAEVKEGMEAVMARLKEQDSKIRKVSAELAVSKAEPRVVLNHP
jgi:hypothetical protein